MKTSQRAAARVIGLVTGLVIGVVMGPAAGATASARAAPAIQIEVLSSRPDMISGEDALLAVRATNPAQLDEVRIRLNGRDVTAALSRAKGEDRLVGLISGLHPGENTLEAIAPGAAADRLSLVAHSINGPIFAGPHMTPYECRTVEAGLGPASDSDCNAPTQIRYFYKSQSGPFKPLPDTNALPADVATTRTRTGVTSPYVVRVETGVIDRAIYRIAVLAPPSGTAGEPPKLDAWNHRLVVAFGGGCGVHYNQGADNITAVLSDVELSQGYAYAVSPALVAQQFCNPALEGETLMMLKEHFIKTYGLPVWTAGFGPSGGAIQQYEIGEMYPGLLDGLQTGLSFPDYQLQSPIDSEVLRQAFDRDPSRWTPEKKTAVSGETASSFAGWHATFGAMVQAAPAANPLSATAAGALIADNDRCGLRSAALIYDAASNPTGVRCSIYDGQVNLLGHDANGIVRRPWDNAGVQYGLGALNAGKITPEDFLTLNETVGGFDTDGRLSSARSVADPIAVREAYATGLMNSGGGGLGTVPILTLRYYVDQMPTERVVAFHDRTQDFIIRSRLAHANGDADNQIIWTRAPDPTDVFRAPALDVMALWLDAIQADPAPLTHAKVVRLKPAIAQDTCWGPKGEKLIEPASYAGNSQCNSWYPPHLEPRMVAGEPLTNDVMKCALKPVSPTDYTPPLDPDQLTRVRAIFPAGVCDYTRPGEGQVAFEGSYAASARTSSANTGSSP
jgi:Tannase-like family of unknown function (DUF6351)